jgi:hypothetical protein
MDKITSAQDSGAYGSKSNSSGEPAEQYFGANWGEDEQGTYQDAAKALRQALGDRTDDDDDEGSTAEY